MIRPFNFWVTTKYCLVKKSLQDLQLDWNWCNDFVWAVIFFKNQQTKYIFLWGLWPILGQHVCNDKYTVYIKLPWPFMTRINGKLPPQRCAQYTTYLINLIIVRTPALDLAETKSGQNANSQLEPILFLDFHNDMCAAPHTSCPLRFLSQVSKYWVDNIAHASLGHFFTSDLKYGCRSKNFKTRVQHLWTSLPEMGEDR